MDTCSAITIALFTNRDYHRVLPICRVAHAFVSKPFRHKLSLSIGSRESCGDFHFSTASMAEVKDQLSDAFYAELVQAGDAQDAMTQVEGTPEEAKGEENGEAKGEENGAAKGQENGKAKGEEKGEEKGQTYDCTKCLLAVTADEYSGLPSSTGKVICKRCNSRRATMSKLFGSWPIPEFEEMGPEWQEQFWKSECANRKKDLMDEIIRMITQSKISRKIQGHSGKYLPLTWYKAQGFDILAIEEKCKDTHRNMKCWALVIRLISLRFRAGKLKKRFATAFASGCQRVQRFCTWKRMSH